MRTVNIHEAKTHLSKLVEQAAAGEPFVIAKAGRPMVRVVPLDTPEPDERTRIGFLKGWFHVPDDFDQMGADAIASDFEGPGLIVDPTGPNPIADPTGPNPIADPTGPNRIPK